ncbi:hypothetical protein Baya_6708 [Bagarius yarrelli]|uniref:Uncharacterized protein n=1 Tax=Bagarius yarrelli TaxID=175774 RepID=A0A556U1M4_BAGYA|nr:hypothetical protein Baya_6708 [Bagarius yarrelli]
MLSVNLSPPRPPPSSWPESLSALNEMKVERASKSEFLRVCRTVTAQENSVPPSDWCRTVTAQENSVPPSDWCRTVPPQEKQLEQLRTGEQCSYLFLSDWCRTVTAQENSVPPSDWCRTVTAQENSVPPSDWCRTVTAQENSAVFLRLIGVRTVTAQQENSVPPSDWCVEQLQHRRTVFLRLIGV